MGHIEGLNREQLMMTDLESLVSENNECCVIDAFYERLDMKNLGFINAEAKEEGRPSYSPEALLKLYLYGMLNCICSSGKLAKEAQRNIEVMWLLNGLQPSKRTLCYFKENNKKALKQVFKEFNRFYRSIGLFGKSTVALDSVKVKANNSKKRNHNKKTIERTISKTETRIDEYMAALDEADKNDNYNEELNLSKEQIKGIIDKLEAKKARYEDLKDQLEEREETQISETDADSRCMKQGSGKGMDVSYNTQVVTEEKNKMIVDFETTNSGSDKGHLVEMGERAKDFLETDKINMLADTGYHNGKEMLEAEKNGITCVIPKGKAGNQKEDKGYNRDKFIYDENKDVYICPNNQILTKKREQKDSNGDSASIYANYSACASCPHRAKCTKRKFREISRKSFQTEVDKLDKRFLKMKGEYKKRQEIIEHQFGTVKWVWGFDRYYTKGIDFADAENALRFTAYNLRRAINLIGVKRLVELAKAYLSVLFKSFSIELTVLYYCLFNKRKLSVL